LWFRGVPRYWLCGAGRFSQSGRPIERYSGILLVFEDGAWQTARVYDNHLGTNHMHRYIGSRQLLEQNS
jgi:hypothetical protein